MAFVKGIRDAGNYDGSSLRIAIVHACWNIEIVDKLVAGAKKSLLSSGVEEDNIVVQRVPGCWELPVAVQQIIATVPRHEVSTPPPSSPNILVPQPYAFAAVIAIGVLIKGETMHFEHIAESVSRGLMRVQLDSHVPVVFGVLTTLDGDQAKKRAGMGEPGENHGEQWGKVAVEMGVKNRLWAKGEFD